MRNYRKDDEQNQYGTYFIFIRLYFVIYMSPYCIYASSLCSLDINIIKSLASEGAKLVPLFIRFMARNGAV